MANSTNGLVRASLTDLYQLTMAYAYWKAGRANDPAVFDLFYRKNPFGGEFAILGGVEEAINFVANFHFTGAEIAHIKKLMPGADEKFFYWLRGASTKGVKINAIPEGSVVFPREPLLRVEGPLAVCQLLETALLNLINFPSLIATNAARFRLAAGSQKTLIEFGLRRAQGPDGAISASRYSVLGGFDGTSNVLASMLFDIPCRGTHAHAFVSSFMSLEELKDSGILDAHGNPNSLFVDQALKHREKLGAQGTNDGELASFIAYAQAFPEGFLALVDTYNTLESGVLNFLCVALALIDNGYKPIGVRIDSGDLAFLSKRIRVKFDEVGRNLGYPELAKLTIFASNDINETVLRSLKEQGHQIDAFGIGTHLVTCQAQPAFGAVYKLVSIKGHPRIKVSEESEKITLPGRKEVYRLFGKDGVALADLITMAGEEEPKVGEEILCCHPANPNMRVRVIPSKVVRLLIPVWGGDSKPLTLKEAMENRKKSLVSIREDHKRVDNPTPYKVSVSQYLFDVTGNLLRTEAPVSVIQ